jgi:hypothetical protein
MIWSQWMYGAGNGILVQEIGKINKRWASAYKLELMPTSVFL